MIEIQKSSIRILSSYKYYYERNNEYISHNAIFITENEWQKDKKPTKEMVKAAIDKFHRLNPKLIEYNKCNKVQQVKYSWEFRYTLFMKYTRSLH